MVVTYQQAYQLSRKKSPEKSCALKGDCPLVPGPRTSWPKTCWRNRETCPLFTGPFAMVMPYVLPDLTALPAVLRCVGETPAGQSFFKGGEVRPVPSPIMTWGSFACGGRRRGDGRAHWSLGDDLEIQRCVRRWENVVLQGSEAARARVSAWRGRRLQAAEIGVGWPQWGKQTVRGLPAAKRGHPATGDEVVPVEQRPTMVSDSEQQCRDLGRPGCRSGWRARTARIGP